MLERAKGCLEQGGRRLLRFPHDQPYKIRLNQTFWTHGAGDIDYSSFWLSLLSPSSARTPDEQQPANLSSRRLAAGLAAGCGSGRPDNGSPFLDFLYPTKTLKYLHTLNTQGSHRTVRSSDRKRSSTTVRAYSRRRSRRTSLIASKEDEYLKNLWEEVSGPEEAEVEENGLEENGAEQPEVRKDEDLENRRQEHTFYRADSWKAWDAPRKTESQLDASKSYDQTRVSNRREATVPVEELARTPLLRRHNIDNLLEAWEKFARDSSAFTKTLEKLSPREEDRLFSEARTLAVEDGEELEKLGRHVITEAQYAIRSYLVHDKPTSTWNDDDWRVGIQVFARSRQMYAEFLDIFRNGLRHGKEQILMPILTETLLEEAWRAPLRFWKLYDIYDEWKNELSPEDERKRTPFWNTLLQIEHVSTQSMVENAVKVIKTSRQVHSQAPRNDVLVELINILMTRKDYRYLDKMVAETLYKQLTHLIGGIKDYKTLHNLLRKVLFSQSTFRDLDGRVALIVYQNMARFGGYKGEESGLLDLGRKLFWRLAKLRELPGIGQVFSDLQMRGKDYATEYSYLLKHLSRAGQQREFERLREIFESKDYRGSHRGIGARNQWDLCHDTLIMYSSRKKIPALLKLFEQMQENPELTPTVLTYNIVISAHMRAEDLEGAEKWFSNMVAAGIEPDVHSYIPFMSEAARRGEVETVRALTRAIEAADLALNDTVVDCHVRALIQAGALSDAKNLVFRSSSFQMSDPRVVWNRIIGAYASRGDRHQVNSLILAMKKNGISLTEQTRAYRMRMWCARLNPRRAEIELTKMAINRVHQPQNIHYAVVMKGWLDIQRPRDAMRIFKMFQRADLNLDWSLQLLLSNTIEQLRSTDHGLSSSEVETFKRMVKHSEHNSFAIESPFLQNNVDRLGETYSTVYFQFLASVAPGETEVDRINNAWTAFLEDMESSGEAMFDVLPPVSVLTRLLGAYMRHEMWDKFEVCWDQIYEKVKDLDRHTKSRLPDNYRRRYMLCRPLYTYLQGLSKQNQLEPRAGQLIEKLAREGFELDTRCWNQYVRLLALAGPENREKAFATAQERLMPGWQGWPKRKHNSPLLLKRGLRERLLYYLRLTPTKVAGYEEWDRVKVLRFRKSRAKVDLEPHMPVAATNEVDWGDEKPSDSFTLFDKGLQSSSEPYAVSDVDLGSVLVDASADEVMPDPQSQPSLESTVAKDVVGPETTSTEDVAPAEGNESAEPGQVSGLAVVAGTADNDPSAAAQQQQQQQQQQPEGYEGDEGDEGGKALMQGKYEKMGPLPPASVYSAASASASAASDPGGRLLGRQQHDERLLRGRPDYSTLVILTRAFLDLRLGATFDQHTGERVRELSRVAPTVVRAVLTMPRVDDSLQLSFLRRQ